MEPSALLSVFTYSLSHFWMGVEVGRKFGTEWRPPLSARSPGFSLHDRPSLRAQSEMIRIKRYFIFTSRGDNGHTMNEPPASYTCRWPIKNVSIWSNWFWFAPPLYSFSIFLYLSLSFSLFLSTLPSPFSLVKKSHQLIRLGVGSRLCMCLPVDPLRRTERTIRHSPFSVAPCSTHLSTPRDSGEGGIGWWRVGEKERNLPRPGWIH